MEEIGGIMNMTRKTAALLKPTLDFVVTKGGKHWKIMSTSTLKTRSTEVATLLSYAIVILISISSTLPCP
jgi:hypothetical protein